eukprot:TRINITY_DN12545_c0_g1_i1.p1 TRINITY_DN12545_c0_g1~~TRINITY_DN12545_c0_g1_i1.p1  ORF type:complete len:292 (+),score=92.25 TRINITY_DN12545_c0_g1_i1:56-877(+)
MPRPPERDEFVRLSSEFKEQCRREVEEEVMKRFSATPPGKAQTGQAFESQRCPVCYDVMLPPDASPHMCVPCGHTFCERCLQRLCKHSGRGAPCPVCRAPVQTTVPNHSLRCVNETLVAAVPQPQESKLAPDLESTISAHVDDDKIAQVRQYLSAFALADARDRVVAAEEESAAEELAQATRQAEIERGVVEYLTSERSGLQEQIERLRSELAAVSSQLEERTAELSTAEGRKEQAEHRLGALRSHRETLGRDSLKARAIVSHLAPSLDLSRF